MALMWRSISKNLSSLKADILFHFERHSLAIGNTNLRTCPKIMAQPMLVTDEAIVSLLVE
jgi:hypothetical protein